MDFYVLLGLTLYLAGWRRGDRARLACAFAALSAGVLVHYSAAPYALFLGLHYLVAVFPGRPARSSTRQEINRTSHGP